MQSPDTLRLISFPFFLGLTMVTVTELFVGPEEGRPFNTPSD